MKNFVDLTEEGGIALLIGLFCLMVGTLELRKDARTEMLSEICSITKVCSDKQFQESFPSN